MENIRAYWVAVRLELDKLKEPFYYVMSLNEPTRGLIGGSVVHVTADAAAQAIVKKTHRLATAEEIENYLDAQAKLREQNAAAEHQRLLTSNPFYAQHNSQIKGAKK